MTNLYHKYGIFRRKELFYQDKYCNSNEDLVFL